MPNLGRHARYNTRTDGTYLPFIYGEVAHDSTSSQVKRRAFVNFDIIMAPAAVSNTESAPPLSGKIKSLPKPLKSSGTLAEFAWEDMTPVIGREFPTINLVDDVLHAPNADDLLRDLAIESGFTVEIPRGSRP